MPLFIFKHDIYYKVLSKNKKCYEKVHNLYYDWNFEYKP